MGAALKLTAIGNSIGLILPKEILVRLRVRKGDALYVVETPGGIELTPYRPDFAQQLDLSEEVMRENRDVSKKLTG